MNYLYVYLQIGYLQTYGMDFNFALRAEMLKTERKKCNSRMNLLGFWPQLY